MGDDLCFWRWTKKGKINDFCPFVGRQVRGLLRHKFSNLFIINVLQETERAITSAAALVSGLR
jgi:hypothetical protein